MTHVKRAAATAAELINEVLKARTFELSSATGST
jgi:hypothetical protein